MEHAPPAQRIEVESTQNEIEGDFDVSDFPGHGWHPSRFLEGPSAWVGWVFGALAKRFFVKKPGNV